MSYFLCAISNTIPTNPVVGKTTGLIYDKSTIEKYININNECPITKLKLHTEDLIEIKNQHEISSFLSSTQGKDFSLNGVFTSIGTGFNELLEKLEEKSSLLDGICEEIESKKQIYEASLSTLMKVMNRQEGILKEIDSLKENLLFLDKEIEKKIEKEMEIPTELRSNLKELFSSLAKLAFDKRKQLKKQNFQVETYKYREFKQIYTALSRDSDSNSINISNEELKFTKFDIKNCENRILIGDNNGNCHLLKFDLNKNDEINLVFKQRLFNNSISDISFLPINPMIFGATSLNSTISNIYGYSDKLNKLETLYKVTCHLLPIKSFSFHPSSEYCIFTSEDKTFSIHNILKGVCLQQKEIFTEKVNKIKFCPDGNLFGALSSNQLELYSIEDSKCVMNLDLSNENNNQKGFAFSENGYHLISYSNNEVKLWDLRKQNIVSSLMKNDIKYADFDYSGMGISVFTNTEVSIYQTKQLVRKDDYNSMDIQCNRNKIIGGFISSSRFVMCEEDMVNILI